MNSPEQDAIIARLDQLIRQSVPQSVSVPKYGGTLYTLRPEEKEGQFCGVFAYKDHVQLAISNGTALIDPKRLLTGTGKLRRHVNVAALDQIDAEGLTDLLQAAAHLSLAGRADPSPSLRHSPLAGNSSPPQPHAAAQDATKFIPFDPPGTTYCPAAFCPNHQLSKLGETRPV